MTAIKGMTMPEHCGYCRFRYDGFCHALQKRTYSRDECPLVEIPDSVELCVTEAKGRTLPEISAGGVVQEENELNPKMIEAAERNEKRIKERVDRIYDELIAEKRAEIERLKAEIAKMPPLDYDKLAENPPEYPVCGGYKCWDGKEADNGDKL